MDPGLPLTIPDLNASRQARVAYRSIRERLVTLAYAPGLSHETRCDVIAAIAEADLESCKLSLLEARQFARTFLAHPPAPAR